MPVDQYKCDLDPETNTCLKVFLFKNVKNVEAIRQNVIKGVWKCSIIKPSLILDVFQVVVAANRAVLSEKSKTMVTKTVYSEVLYNLSLSKNISQSLSKFGIEQGHSLLVCFLINEDDDSSQDIIKEIEGEQSPLSSLSSLTDMKALKTVYKLNSLKSDENLIDVIVSKMVTKNFINH